MLVHSIIADAIPELRPAEELLPTPFWEQHSQTVLLAGLAVVLLVTLLFWRRRKPPAGTLPPAQIASEALRKLEGARDQIARILDPKFAQAASASGAVIRLGIDDPQTCWPDYIIRP